MLRLYSALLSESVYPGLWACVPGLMVLHTWAHGHRYAGRDKEKTIFTKDSKKNKIQ